MDKFQNKYRLPSNRLPNWDYSDNGSYFITLVTQNRICNLGEIVNNEMVLSDFGNIVKSEWLKSFDIRSELYMDEYVIMPNHIHAIIVLKKNETDGVENNMAGVDATAVETHGRASLQPCASSNSFAFFRKPKSISSFMGGFKSIVNSKIDDYIDKNNLNIPKYNINNHFFQPNYHDHIIRDKQSYERIKNYIINNPKNWGTDKFNSNNV